MNIYFPTIKQTIKIEERELKRAGQHQRKTLGKKLARARARTSICTKISVLPDELLLKIFDFLDFPDQAHSARCCRKWRISIDQGDFQRQVTIKAGLNPATPLKIYIKKKNVAALAIKAQELIERQKKYKVNVLYIDSLLNKVITLQPNGPFFDISRFFRAKLKVECPEIAISDLEAFRVLNHFNNNAAFSVAMHLEAMFLQSVLLVKRRVLVISFTNREFEVAFNTLETVVNHPGTSPEIRVRAQYYQAYLKVEKLITRLTDEAAFDLLEKVVNSRHVDEEFRANAQWCKAILRLEKRTRRLTDEEAFIIFDAVSKNEYVDSYIRAAAQYAKIHLRVMDRTELLTDKEAIHLLEDMIINAPLLFQVLAKFEKACLRVLGKRINLKDDKTFIFLEYLISELIIAAEIRVEAQCLKAYLRVHYRTDRITDEEAFDLLNEVINAEECIDRVRAEARCLKALLRFHGRTTHLTDYEAVLMLNRIANSEVARAATRAEARFLLALFRVQHRTYVLRDKEALDLLNNVANDPKADASTRADARYYIAFMRAEDGPGGFPRNEWITDDEALNLLDNVLSDKNVSSITYDQAIACKKVLIKRHKNCLVRSFKTLTFIAKYG